jgi:hypothetical protein
VFGPVGTLQNVAVISCVQNTPVEVPVVVPFEAPDVVLLVVPVEVPVAVPVATCAADGDVAMTNDVNSAMINAACFMRALDLRWPSTVRQ